MSTIFTRPSSSGDCSSGNLDLNSLSVSGALLMAPLATMVIDEIPTSDYIAAVWMIRIVDLNLGNVEGYIFYSFFNDSTTYYLKYASLGANPVNHTPHTEVNGGQFQFKITNNTTSDLLVYIFRFPLPSIPDPEPIIPSGFSPTARISIRSSAAPNSATVVDSAPALLSRAVRWLVQIADPSNGLILAQEVFATSGAATPVAGTVYSIIGDPIDMSTDVNLVGNGTALIINNNTANSLTVNITREELDIPEGLLPPTSCNNLSPSCSSDDLICNLIIPFTQTTITPSNTVTIDSFNIIGYRAAKWILVMMNPTAGTAESYQVLMTFKTGVSPFISSYGFLGDILNHDLNIIQSGITLSLQITNNEANNIVVYLIQVPVSL